MEKAILRRDWLATSILLNNIQHVSTITSAGLPDPISLSEFQVVHKIPDEELKQANTPTALLSLLQKQELKNESRTTKKIGFSRVSLLHIVKHVDR